MAVSARHVGFALGWVALMSGCFTVLPSQGGGQTEFRPPRKIDVADIAVPGGYEVAAVTIGLTYPTAVVFDDAGRTYVLEAGYAYGEVFTQPRLLRLESSGGTTVVATGEKGTGPWTGAAFHEGNFYVTDGGNPGRILRIAKSGRIDVVASGMPSRGDHHTNAPVVGPDGMLYFTQGTITNSGVVGTDNYDFGWLERHPALHDVPCRDIRVTTAIFESDNPLSGEGARAFTAPFMPFGVSAPADHVVRGSVPCSGAVMRVRLEGGKPELVAWGLRNPFSMRFGPDGKLYVSENGFDVRGSRPVFGASDNLWSVDVHGPVRWFGWPDFSGGLPVTGPGFKPPRGPRPAFILAEHPEQPPLPVAQFGVHSSVTGFDFSTSDAFGLKGEAFVALFGDMAPDVGKVIAPVGFRVMRVDLKTGHLEEFMTNKGDKTAPASYLGRAGIERPIDVKFDPRGETLYVLDFGVMPVDGEGPHPYPKTGVLWKVGKKGAASLAHEEVQP